jgi:hypothetical protein
MNQFDEWFEIFLEEKNLPYIQWEIADKNGEINFIDSEVVIETIKGCYVPEKMKIKDMLIKIDFANGNVNDYFKHLATGLINNRG